jgi:glycosyltransferase involved in cell wall biosynthesis
MQDKKKILYLITQSELGGAQQYVLDLVHGTEDEFEVFVAFGEQGKQGELAKRLKPTEAVYYVLPHLRRAINPINELMAFYEIYKLVKRLKPDIIHLNSSKISGLGSVSSTLAHPKAKIIYTAHGWVFNEPERDTWFHFWSERAASWFEDRIICISQMDLEIARARLKIPEEKLALVHNGREEINHLPREEARKKLRIADNTTLIGSIGNLYKTKGFEYFIKAVKKLKESFEIPNFKFKIAIIGEGSERAKLEKLIKQNNLENTFVLAGRIDNASELLKAFDIYVCSSVKEGLSYTLIEAMQAALPIVTTNVGGNPDLVFDKKEGLLVTPKSPDKLASAIEYLIKNQDTAKELGQNAREKALNEFSLNQMINKTKSVYN